MITNTNWTKNYRDENHFYKRKTHPLCKKQASPLNL